MKKLLLGLMMLFVFVLFGSVVNAQYVYNDFDESENETFFGWPDPVTKVSNPFPGGINTSANVGMWNRSDAQQYANIWIDLTGTIDFTTGTTFQLKVYSPIVCDVLFKLEGSANPVEVLASVTSPNQWELLTYDFSGSATGVYNKIVVFFDFNPAVLTTNIFYFDDVEGPEYDGGSIGNPVSLPVTFDDDEVNYGLTDFEGMGPSEIIVDPTNATNNVVKSIKPETAGTSAGTTVGQPAGFTEEIPFEPGSTFMTVRVWSPTAGTPIRLKVEDFSDPSKSVETETLTTIGSDWENILFDFSNEAPGTEPIHFDYYYNKASIFFDFGSPGLTGGTTYYWDDMDFGNLTSVESRNIETLTFLQNPIQDVLTLNTTTNIESIHVYSFAGQSINVKEIGSNSYDLSGLSKGVYTVLVIDEKGNNLVGKVLKQ